MTDSPGGTPARNRAAGLLAVTATSASVTVAGPATFVAEARAMRFGTKDLASASDRELLKLGKVVCGGLDIKDLGFRRVVQRLVQSDACPTTAEATPVVRSAVRNLCPEHRAPAKCRYGR